jgi:hypothetical protein
LINPIDFQNVRDAFTSILCNTLSIGDTYCSNHTLTSIGVLDSEDEPQEADKSWSHLRSLLILNKGKNKRHVAIKKILQYHPNIDMKPFFHWDMKEGERNLKALPYVVSWFDKAREVAAGDTVSKDDHDDDDTANSDDEKEAVADDNISYNVDEKKLSAIFQFALAMPLLFVPASHIKVELSKKRKRGKKAHLPY